MATNQLASAPARRFKIVLHKHTGMLIIMRTARVPVQGTLAELEAAFHKAQRHNLMFGWWGLLSLSVMNWIAIVGNRRAIAAVRKQAALPA